MKTTGNPVPHAWRSPLSSALFVLAVGSPFLETEKEEFVHAG